MIQYLREQSGYPSQINLLAIQTPLSHRNSDCEHFCGFDGVYLDLGVVGTITVALFSAHPNSSEPSPRMNK